MSLRILPLCPSRQEEKYADKLLFKQRVANNAQARSCLVLADNIEGLQIVGNSVAVSSLPKRQASTPYVTRMPYNQSSLMRTMLAPKDSLHIASRRAQIHLSRPPTNQYQSMQRTVSMPITSARSTRKNQTPKNIAAMSRNTKSDELTERDGDGGTRLITYADEYVQTVDDGYDDTITVDDVISRLQPAKLGGCYEEEEEGDVGCHGDESGETGAPNKGVTDVRFRFKHGSAKHGTVSDGAGAKPASEAPRHQRPGRIEHDVIKSRHRAESASDPCFTEHTDSGYRKGTPTNRSKPRGVSSSFIHVPQQQDPAKSRRRPMNGSSSQKLSSSKKSKSGGRRLKDKGKPSSCCTVIHGSQKDEEQLGESADSDVDQVVSEGGFRRKPGEIPVREFIKLPDRKPKVVCFDYPGCELSHCDVINAIESAIPDAFEEKRIVTVQFENRSVKLHSEELHNRWHIELSDFITRNRLLKSGLTFTSKAEQGETVSGSGRKQQQHVALKLYDAVTTEEYKRFLRHRASSEQLQNYILLSTGSLQAKDNTPTRVM